MERMWPGGVSAYEQKVGEDISIAKWKELVTEPIQVSDSEVLDAYRARANHAAIDYVVVPSAKQDVASKLSDAEIRAWYDSHKESYKRGEPIELAWTLAEGDRPTGLDT